MIFTLTEQQVMQIHCDRNTYRLP